MKAEINIYRVSDHALVKTLTTTVSIPCRGLLHDNEKDQTWIAGSLAAHQIKQALKNISLSSIPPEPPSALPPSSVPVQSSIVSQASPEVEASVQLSSEPSGAEIAVNGNYVGNTPSLIKLKPGTHTIKVTKKSYETWERSIITEAGESSNIAADLEKTSQ